MTDALIDPVRILRHYAQIVQLNPAFHDAIEKVCDEVGSLRVEAYEGWRREVDNMEGATVTEQHRIVGVKRDGLAYKSDPYKGEHGKGLCEYLLTTITDGRMEWEVEPHIETRLIVEYPWTP